MFGLDSSRCDSANRNNFTEFVRIRNSDNRCKTNVLNPWKNDEVDRDLESALPSGLLPHSTPATLYWLRNNYEIVEGVCIPRYIIYDHYKDFCRKYRIAPVNAASFGKILKQVFPNVSTRRLGNRGRSKYHYFGLGIQINSSYNDTRYSKKAYHERSETHTEPSQISSLSTLHCGMMLLEFPNMEDFSLPSDSDDTVIQVSGFIAMYHTHCQSIYDSILLSNLEEVKYFIHHFWKGVPIHLMPKMSSCAVINTIGVCDSILYRTIISVLMSSFLQCLNHSLLMGIQEFANNLGTWLHAALVHMPKDLYTLKIKIAQWFSRMLRRQLVLTEICCNIKTVLKDTRLANQMLIDWKSVDLTCIQRDTKSIAYSCYDKQKNSMLIDMLCQKFKEYSKLLESHAPIESFKQWLDSIVEHCVVQLAGRFNVPLLQWARYFLMIWVAYDSRIVRDMTLAHSKSFGSFHMLNIMSSDYLQQSIDLLFLEDLTNRLQHSLPLDTFISDFFQKLEMDTSENMVDVPTTMYKSCDGAEESNNFLHQESFINTTNFETVPFSSAAVMAVSHNLFEYGLNIIEATQTYNLYSQHDYLNGNRSTKRNETITSLTDTEVDNITNTIVSPEYLECMFLQDWNTNSLLHSHSNLPHFDLTVDRQTC